MIKWNQITDTYYEARLGTAIMATVWYHKPFFFEKGKPRWKCRTTFRGVNLNGYGADCDTAQEAMDRMDVFLIGVAEEILEDRPVLPDSP